MKKTYSILFLILTTLLSIVSLQAANGGVWETAKALTSSGANNSSQIALDCNGDGICVWYDETGTNTIYAARYDATLNSWGTPQTVSDSGENIDPQIALDCNGNGICVWQNNTNNDIYASRYNATLNSWGTPQAVSDSGTNQTPQIAIDCNGNGICVWYNFPNGDIYAARYDATTNSWGTPQTVSTSGSNYEPHIALDCNGNGICVWYTIGGHIWAARYIATSHGWETPQLVSTPGRCDNDGPQIAIDCNGNGISVFEDSGENIYAARFAAVPAPSNIQSTQELHRFATQGDLVNVLSWDAVSFTNPIVKYKISCTPYVAQTPCCENCCDCKIRCCVCPCYYSTLVGEVSASTQLVFRHHNRCYDQRVTYCLTAVDNVGNETPVPSSVTVPAV